MRLAFILLLFFVTTSSQAQIGGSVAPYSRMGFSARGIAMGNSIGAVTTEGEYHPYYNPAVLGFAEFQTATATYGALTWDRKLNFLSYTGKVGPEAGIGLSLINSGVNDIDGRTNDGRQTSSFATSENLFLISFALRPDENLSIGISMRGYLASFYKELPNSFSVGFDAGVLYRIFPDSISTLSFSLGIADIASKYKWNTAEIYGQSGSTTTDKFPIAFKVGAAYSREGIFGMKLILISSEIDLLKQSFDGKQINYVTENGVQIESYETVTLTRSEVQLKFGLMLQPVRALKLRVGIDRLGLQGINLTESARVSGGFSIEYPVQNYIATIDYAILFEPYAPTGTSFFTLGVRF